MSSVKKQFGKAKGKEENSSQSSGTILRQPDKATPITKEKEGPEYTALEMAERQDWEVKSLPVWQPGDVILGTYEVEDVISGGMGHVYIANHNKWNVKLAIKSPNEMMLENKSNFARILREANSWTELGLHPNIAYCYYVRNIEEIPHIFVEYVDGGNLRQWIEEGKCIDYRTSLDLAIQFCHGMEHAHSKGMIHRDIKPENILMTQDGVLKITDFGLVRSGDSLQAEDPSIQKGSNEEDSSLTVVGAEMGTRGYMSPEQKENPHAVDERTDIFSFGICLYEMFCGNRPYEITFGPKQDPPDPMSLSGDANFPSDIGPVLSKTVQWEPHKRYQNFADIRQALLRIYQKLFGKESPYAEMQLLDLEADGLNNQGVSYFDLGRKEDAISCWEKALEINQMHPEATYNLSLIQWRDAKVADDEVLRRLDNCENNPAVDPEKLAEIKAFIHTERLDFDAARNVLKAIPGRYEALFSGKNVDQLGSIHTLEGHTSRILSIAISPDGRHAVSGSWDKTARVWELASGRCVHTLEGHADVVQSVAFSTDGRYALSGSRDKTIRVWELASGRCVYTLEGHKYGVGAVAISSDGRYAVSGGYKTLRVWEFAKGNCVCTLEGHKRGVESVTITPDGRYAVSGSSDNTVRVWELATGQCVYTLEGHTHEANSVAITPDGRYAVSGSSDNTVRVWDLSSGQCVNKLEGHALGVTCIALSPDSRYAVSGGLGKTLRAWELASGRCINNLEGHTDGVLSVAFTPGGRYALSGSWDRTIRVWELTSGRCVRTLEGHTLGVQSIAITPDGCYAVSGSVDKTVRVWKIVTDSTYMANLQVSLLKGFKERKKEDDALDQLITEASTLYEKRDYRNSFSVLYDAWKNTGFSDNDLINRLYFSLMKKGRIKSLNFAFQGKSLIGHMDKVRSVAISPDGRYVVSGSADETVRMWELKSGRCVHTLKGHKGAVESVAVSPNSRYAVSCSRDKTVRVWELASGRCVHTLKGHKGAVESVALSPDGRYVLSGSWDRTMRVWELASGRCTHKLDRDIRVILSLAITTDGRHAVLSSDREKTVRVWEFTSGRCVRTLEGHTDKVRSVALSPDSRYAGSGSNDKTVRVWEHDSGRCIHILGGHRNWIGSVAFSPDGQYVASGSLDKTLRVWDLAKSRCVYILEGHTEPVTSVAVSPNNRYLASCSWDKTVRLWELIWDLEFPDPVDWDEGLRPYLEIFLTLRNGKWTEVDFQTLINELAEKRGYGWVRPEGIRKELEKMSQNWKP